MAIAYNRYTGNNSVGVYKDIVDDLFYVNVNETPIMDMSNSIESSSASDYVHYWEEVVHGAKTSNPYKRNEGGDLSTDYTPPTKTERSNTVVESAVPFTLSLRSEAIAKKKGMAGIRNAWERAKADAMVELKDGLEWSLLNGTQASGDSVSVASECNGLLTMAASLGTAAYNTNISGGESNFRTGLNTNKASGGMSGKKKMIFTSYTNKDAIANWTGRATQVQNPGDDAKVYADIEIYVSQYGPIVIMGHTMCASTKLCLFDAQKLSVAWLYPTQTVELGTTKLVAGSLAVANCATLQYDTPSTLFLMTIS